MKEISYDKDHITLQLSVKELDILKNALKETYKYLEEWEFEIRMSFSYKEAEITLENIASIKNGINNHQDPQISSL